MKSAAGARVEERDGRTADLFAGMALAELEDRLTPRLRAIVRLLRLRGGDGATTWELLQASRSVAVHSTVAELRARLAAIGWQIRCEREAGTAAGRDLYRYRLEEATGA